MCARVSGLCGTYACTHRRASYNLKGCFQLSNLRAKARSFRRGRPASRNCRARSRLRRRGKYTRGTRSTARDFTSHRLLRLSCIPFAREIFFHTRFASRSDRATAGASAAGYVDVCVRAHDVIKPDPPFPFLQEESRSESGVASPNVVRSTTAKTLLRRGRCSNGCRTCKRILW